MHISHPLRLRFQFSIRMVKTRITKWNLHKNHQYRDMRTAIEMLGPDRSTWPAPEPRFLIRGKVVDFHDILLYFQRKGINDPIQWAFAASKDDFKLSPNVQILWEDGREASGPTVGSPSSSTATAITQVASMTTTNQPGTGTSMHGGLHNTHADIGALQTSSPLVYQSSDPEIHRDAAQIVWQMRTYCLSYLDSSRATAHKEPEVHQFTTHGSFGDRMQNGLSLLIRREYPLAFQSFHCAFSMIPDILKDHHPMSLALFMTVICELVSKDAKTIAMELLRHTSQLATILPNVPAYNAALFSVILQSDQCLEHVVLSMRAVTDIFEINAPTQWKTLYIKERYCDCLYHAKTYGEGSMRRAQLLVEQEAFYGRFARNVLWTLTNVADDHLTYMRLDDAESHFLAALERASHLTRFGRAKIHFAALEGLAKTSKSKVEMAIIQQKHSHQTPALACSSLQKLQEALKYLDEALEIAMTWFEPASRRISRVLDLKSQMLAMVPISGLEFERSITCDLRKVPTAE